VEKAHLKPSRLLAPLTLSREKGVSWVCLR
jgi:hypothetical protein